MNLVIKNQYLDRPVLEIPVGITFGNLDKTKLFMRVDGQFIIPSNTPLFSVPVLDITNNRITFLQEKSTWLVYNHKLEIY